MNINTNIKYKLKNPDKGEENIVYEIVNVNDVTKRVMIKPININMNILPIELVSIDDLKQN